MRIAVVGTGISGLAAARILDRRHQVALFDSAGYAGGHTNTVQVNEGRRELAVDTGFIVFNELTYPNLCALFEELGVESRESDMSFSVHAEADGMEYNGTSINKLFSQRSNIMSPRFWSMLREIVRFNRQAPEELARGIDDNVTVAEYCRDKGYGRRFYDYYLLPLGASLWSCDAQRFSSFPIRFVLEFMDNHRMLQVNNRPVWKTVRGGSSRYVDRILAGLGGSLYLDRPVRSVSRHGGGVRLGFENGATGDFDEVVLACHADQALSMLRDADETERALLSEFPYQDNDVVLHTDTRVLPLRRSAWASWNYRVPAIVGNSVTVSYNMNMLQGIDSETTYCVSLNLNQHIDPGRVIRRIRYTHPVFAPGRLEAQKRHAELIRRRGVSCCGAYWGYGFHEDGLVSALRVCDSFDLEMAA